MSGYKFRPNKTSTKSVFIDAIDARNVKKIHEYLIVTSKQTNHQSKCAVSELSRKKLSDLWQCICDTLLTLPPMNRPFIISTGDLPVTVDCNNATNVKSIKQTSVEVPEENLPFNITERTNIAMQLLNEVFPSVASKNAEPPFLADIALVLNSLLEADMYTNEIIRISELLWRKKWTGRSVLAKNPLKIILEKLKEETPTRALVKSMILYKEALKNSEHCLNELHPILIKCLSNTTVLAEQSSAAFLAQLFILNDEILLLCQEEVKNFLISKHATKQHARALGKIYGIACYEASDEIREVLKEKCLQFFMLHFIRTKWNIEKETMLPLGHLLQEFLDEFHNVAKKHPVVLTLLNDAYEPILWRNLSSSNSCYRANASHILLNLFPLERPGVLRDENEKLLSTQYTHIQQLLEDSSHLVRLKVIKVVCHILASYWKCIPYNFKTECCQTIMLKLAFDRSSPEIRKEALDGLAYDLAHGSYSLALFIGQNLNKLEPLLFDESKKVRLAMVKLLISLQKVQHPKVPHPLGRVPTCWSIVKPATIVHMLSEEETGSPMACSLVHLLFDSIHPNDPIKQKQRSVVKRVSWLVKTNLHAARTFYESTGEILSTQNAVRFMLKVLIVLYKNCKHVIEGESLSQTVAVKGRKRKLSVEDKENTNQENIHGHFGHANNSVGSEIEMSSHEEEEEEEQTSEQNSLSRSTHHMSVSLSDPFLVRGLIEVVFVLWLQHEVQLTLPQNEKLHRKLVYIAKDCLVEIHKMWKANDEVMKPLMLLASMLPNKRVRTLVSYSLSQIKCMLQKESEVDKPMASVLLTALCNWNCGDQVLEMLADCFTCTIQDALPMKIPTPRKKKRVKFEAVEKLSSNVAIEFMHCILNHSVNHDYVLVKCHTAMCDILLSLQPVQDLALQRLENYKPLDSISDETIHKLFQRYVYLIPLLKSPINKPFNPSARFKNLVQWADTFLIPFTSAEKMDIENKHSSEIIPLAGLLLFDLCRGISVSVHCTHISVVLTKTLLEFCKTCLNSTIAQFLVPGVLCVTSSLAYQFVCEKQGKRDIIISEDILISDILLIINTALQKCSDSTKLHSALLEDKAENKVESNIEELLIAFCIHFTIDSPELSNLSSSILQAVLQITESETKEIESVFANSLPYPAECLLSCLLHSPISTALIAKQLYGLIYEIGESDSGREAVDIVLKTLELPKWRNYLSDEQRIRCRHAFEACSAAALEKTMKLEVTRHF